MKIFVGVEVENDYDVHLYHLTASSLEEAQKSFATRIANDDYIYETWDIFVNDAYQNLEIHVSIQELELL